MAPKRKRKITEVKGEADVSESREAELRAVLHERVDNMGLVDLIRLCAFTTASSQLEVVKQEAGATMGDLAARHELEVPVSSPCLFGMTSAVQDQISSYLDWKGLGRFARTSKVFHRCSETARVKLSDWRLGYSTKTKGFTAAEVGKLLLRYPGLRSLGVKQTTIGLAQLKKVLKLVGKNLTDLDLSRAEKPLEKLGELVPLTGALQRLTITSGLGHKTSSQDVRSLITFNPALATITLHCTGLLPGLLLALEHACPPLLKELDLYYDDNSVNQMVQTLEMGCAAGLKSLTLRKHSWRSGVGLIVVLLRRVATGCPVLETLGILGRNLDQSELDLLGDDSIFPRLRSLKLELRHGEGYGSNEECKSVTFNMENLTCLDLECNSEFTIENSRMPKLRELTISVCIISRRLGGLRELLASAKESLVELNLCLDPDDCCSLYLPYSSLASSHSSSTSSSSSSPSSSLVSTALTMGQPPVFPHLQFLRLTTKYSSDISKALGRDDVIHFLRAAPNLIAIRTDSQPGSFEPGKLHAADVAAAVTDHEHLASLCFGRGVYEYQASKRFEWTRSIAEAHAGRPWAQAWLATSGAKLTNAAE